MNRLLENVQHVPSTIAGGLLTALGVAVTFLDPNHPVGQVVQALAANHPNVAAVASILTGLALIFGVGPKRP